jgi:hypothetical protein
MHISGFGGHAHKWVLGTEGGGKRGRGCIGGMHISGYWHYIERGRVWGACT